MSIKRHLPGKLLSKAVEHDSVVYLCGLVSEDLSLDVAGQTANILKQMDSILAAHATDKSKLLTATIWVTDIRMRDAMNVAWTAWMDPANPPARACIEAKMADVRVLVEIMATCAK